MLLLRDQQHAYIMFGESKIRSLEYSAITDYNKFLTEDRLNLNMLHAVMKGGLLKVFFFEDASQFYNGKLCLKEIQLQVFDD